MNFPGSILVWEENFISKLSLIMFVLIGINESFLFSSIKWWKSLPLEIRTSSSLGIFMHSLLKYWQFPTRNYLFYIGDRSGSISHTRLWLNFSALKYLFFFRKIVVYHQPFLFAIHLLEMKYKKLNKSHGILHYCANWGHCKRRNKWCK